MGLGMGNYAVADGYSPQDEAFNVGFREHVTVYYRAGLQPGAAR